jgi:hypothetical protein
MNNNPQREEDKYSNHGKHSNPNQRRTQEVKTRRTQEKQSGKAKKAPRLCPRVEEAQSEEAGSRPIETVRAAGAGAWHLAGTFLKSEGNATG